MNYLRQYKRIANPIALTSSFLLIPSLLFKCCGAKRSEETDTKDKRKET